MKLVLANNQSKRFVDFHRQIQAGRSMYDYEAYKNLLFEFDSSGSKSSVDFININNSKTSSDYTGVYINGYLNSLELASAVAIVLDANHIPYVNRELDNPPSLSKLTMYAKLAGAGIKIPKTYGGTAYSLINAQAPLVQISFPAVLKRADADRGVDNFTVESYKEAAKMLNKYPKTSLWILQELVPNDGYYLVGVYHQEAAFSIFRALQKRPDGNQKKSHMFKPVGGRNAKLIDLKMLPKKLIATSLRATNAMNRQVASVDSLYDQSDGTVTVLEVNYNPQLATIETFKDIRSRAFLKAIDQLEKNQ